MIVTSRERLIDSEHEVDDEKFISLRYVLSNDGMGYSVHETLIKPGQELHMWYKHHFETVFCLEGRGQIEDLGKGTIHEIQPGTLYALNRHDKHVLRAYGWGLRLFCVFYPALVGHETHQDDGSYPLLDEDGRLVTR